MRLTQIQKRSGEASITLYRRQHYRLSVVSIGNLKKIWVKRKRILMWHRAWPCYFLKNFHCLQTLFFNWFSLLLIQKTILGTRINRHKKTCPKAGFFEDLSQVFPCFHCGGSQLLTNKIYRNRTSNKPLACGFVDWHI